MFSDLANNCLGFLPKYGNKIARAQLNKINLVTKTMVRSC
jgi:hypothetical protein